jgi:hypothetical protein
LTKEIQQLVWELHQSAPDELAHKAVDDTNDLIFRLAMFERALERVYEPKNAEVY